MKKVLEYAIIAVGGGIYYFLLEMLWRGRSHYTMIILGGISVLTLYGINGIKKLPFALKCLFGALMITLYEFFCGLVVNLKLGFDVWDYSKLPLNLLGQISLASSSVWLILCIPAFYMCRILTDIFNFHGDQNE